MKRIKSMALFFLMAFICSVAFFMCDASVHAYDIKASVYVNGNEIDINESGVTFVEVSMEEDTTIKVVCDQATSYQWEKNWDKITGETQDTLTIKKGEYPSGNVMYS